MIFSDTDTAVLKAWRSEALEAYRRIIAGAQVAEVRDQNGELVRYSRANIEELSRWLRLLDSEIAAREGRSGAAGVGLVWIR